MYDPFLVSVIHKLCKHYCNEYSYIIIILLSNQIQKMAFKVPAGQLTCWQIKPNLV